MRRGEDQPHVTGGQRRFELLGVHQIIDRHHHPSRRQDGERRDDPDRRVGRPNRNPTAPTDLGVSQPVGQAEHVVGDCSAVPSRNAVFSEDDDARVLVARFEIAQ